MPLIKQTYFLTNDPKCPTDGAFKIEATSHNEAASEYFRLHHGDFDYAEEETFWVWLPKMPMKRITVKAERTYDFFPEELGETNQQL